MHYHLYITAATASSSFFTCIFCAAKIGIPFLPSWASGLLQEDIVVSGPFQLPRSPVLQAIFGHMIPSASRIQSWSYHFLPDTAFWNDKLLPNKVSLGPRFKGGLLFIFQSPTFSLPKTQIQVARATCWCWPEASLPPVDYACTPPKVVEYTTTVYTAWSWWIPRKRQHRCQR